MLHKYSTSFLSSPGVWYTLLTLNYIFLTFVALSLFFLLPRNSVKNPPAVWETWVSSLGWEDPLEEGMATHSSILAWRIPMDRGAWRATVHGVTESRTRLWLITAQKLFLSLFCLVGRPYPKHPFSTFPCCSPTESIAAVCVSSLYIFSAQHLCDCHRLFSSLSLCSTGMMPPESSCYLIKYTSDIRLLKWIECKCIQRIPNLHAIQFQSDWAAVAGFWNLSKFNFLPQRNGGFHEVITTLPSSAAIWTRSFFFFNFYWNLVALQCCVSFCWTAKWISHVYTYISSFNFLPI